jgi:hypothetical protein
LKENFAVLFEVDFATAGHQTVGVGPYSLEYVVVVVVVIGVVTE